MKFLLLLIPLLLLIGCGDDEKKETQKPGPCDNCESWQQCSPSGQACVAKPGMCDSHLDCTDEGVKTWCEADTHNCIEKIDFSCDLCKVWETCDAANKRCTLNENRCYTTEDCGENATCNEETHTCIFDCTSCKAWELCNDAQTGCDPKPGSCSTEADCGNWGNCDTEAHRCTASTGRCTDDEDCGEALACNEQHYCGNDQYITTTIKWLQTDDQLLDQNVHLTSVVTGVAISQSGNQKGVYVQSGTEPYSGIYIYFNNAGQYTINPGDRVVVTGILDNQLGGRRVRTPFDTINITENDQAIPAPVTIDYFTQSREYESMLTSIKLDSRFNMSQFLPQHYIFRDEAGRELLVKDTLKHGVFNTLSLDNKLISLVGIIDHDELDYRVLPRDENDITYVTPGCTTTCKEWERCVDDDLCILDEDRCDQQSDCKKPGAICNTEQHWCELPAEMVNGDLETWDDETTPTGYMVREALMVSREEITVHGDSYAAKVTRRNDLIGEDKTRGNILSPGIAVKGYKNYRLKAFVYDNDLDVDARMVYELYDIYNQKIGSGIPISNDGYTYNSKVWQELSFDTTFIYHMWSPNTTDDIASIRFGIRLYKAHDNESATGSGTLYLDDLTIEEIE